MSIKTVKTKYGVLSGTEMSGYTIFRGIPYAKPPIGELRFEPPQEPEAWERIRKADKFSARSMQGTMNEGFYGKEFYASPEMIPECSEDCLYLNIWTPAKNDKDCLPVAVWIHGGAFAAGYGSEIEFDGEAFSKKGVILVTVNYRLGVLGFLAHPALSERSERGVSGNYGILDQIAALHWVKDNIAAFGGDPQNVTLFGQSAGGMSVQTICTSPLAKGLVTKAIIQSGGGYNNPMFSDQCLEEAEEFGEKFAQSLGCKTAEELKKVPAEAFVKAMDKMRDEMFRKMQETGEMPKHSLPMSPIIDGYVLTEGYNEAIENGNIADIPYMIGSTKDDMGKEMVHPGDYPDDGNGPLYHAAKYFSLKLQEEGRNPAWCYLFERRLPGDDAGAFHSSELWYVFGTYKRCWRPLTEEDAALSEKMVTFWTDFMKHSNPDETGTEWRPCTKEDQFVYKFNINNTEAGWR